MISLLPLSSHLEVFAVRGVAPVVLNVPFADHEHSIVRVALCGEEEEEDRRKEGGEYEPILV